jgi:preprotein translocase subunit SecA
LCSSFDKLQTVMDPIKAKGTELAKRRIKAEPKRLPSLVEPETPSDQFVSLGAPSSSEQAAPKTASIRPAKHSTKRGIAKAAPSPKAAPTAVPQVLVETTTPTDIAPVGKTLAQVAAEVAAPERKQTPSPLPKPPLSAGRRAGILRRLGHGFLNFLTSDPLQPFQRELKDINKLEKTTSQLQTPEQFQAKTEEFRDRLAQGESLADLRVEAYAVARQAAVKALGMRPYDCQVLGALAMDDGHISEMRTGEGKTLTAVMPLYLNALAGKGAHLVTVNDTLAARDAAEMTPAFNLLGMSVGTVLEDMKKDEKRQGYAADITYTTDRALGFDYLRDKTAKNPNQTVQREPFFALIDEVDEVLIDEARSPLIISATGESYQAEYAEMNEVVGTLQPGSDYFLDRKKHSVWLSDSGMARVENTLSRRELKAELQAEPVSERREAIVKELALRDKLDGLISAEQDAFGAYQANKKSKPGLIQRWRGAEWDDQALEADKTAHDQALLSREEASAKLPAYDLFSDDKSHRVRFLYAALKAHALFEKDKDYTVTDGKVEIVDENKGRTSEGRRYNDGVHQAIEAKEGVAVGDEQRAIASITYPNLFKKYPRLSGMSGTAKSSEHEFLKLYELDVVPVPTNEPVIRTDERDLVFQTLEEKYDALARDASKDFFDGKPVLIGTLSVEHNEYMAKLLLDRGVPRESLQILNAETVRGDKEGENLMIGQAGRSGVISVATNLAGRGANIKPDLINFRQLVSKTLSETESGKPVVVTVRRPSEAEWMKSWLSGMDCTVVPNDHPKGPHTGQIQIRYTKDVDPAPEAPQWADETCHLKGEDYPTGGLTVYGTERSSSRRIDDQLIGRSGRQGAPGRSRFYLSLEDDLLRVFAGSKLDPVLSHFTEPGEGVSGAILDTVIAQAQSSVEGDHFASREATNKSDEVLNVQRDAFFQMRDEVLDGGNSLRERLEFMVSSSIWDTMELPDKSSHSYGDIRKAVAKAEEDLKCPIPLPFLDSDLKHPDSTKMSTADLKLEIADLVNRQTRKIMRTMNKMTGRAEESVRPMLLDTIDNSWSDHLEMMESLRMGVQWQSLAQKDPEVEFKLQAFDLFGESVAHVNKQVTSGLFTDLLIFSSVAA